MESINTLHLKQRWLRALGLSVALGAGLYLAAILLIRAGDVWQAMGRLGLLGWLLILALSLLNYGLRFLRWHYYLRLFGYRLAWLRHGLIYLAGFALTTTPGKAGEALRSVYLAEDRVRYTHSLAALFAERLMDFAAILLLAAAVMLEIEGYARFFLIIAATLLAVLALLRNPAMTRWADARLQGWPDSSLRGLLDKLLGLLVAARRLLSAPMLAAGLVLGLVSWGAEGLGLYLILQAMDAPVGPVMALAIYAMAILIGALSFIPGGLGSTEASMGGLLVLAGTAVPEAVAATLICRAATLWFAVLLGAAALAVLSLQADAGASH